MATSVAACADAMRERVNEITLEIATWLLQIKRTLIRLQLANDKHTESTHTHNERNKK